MALPSILYESADNIAKITLNRPDKRNAQNMRMIAELDEAFRTAEGDDEVRVVILRGAGVCFSSGHDLSFLSKPAEQVDDIVDVLSLRGTPEARLKHEQVMYFDKCLAIRNLSKPTIAQVHGKCIAGGAMLAAMCDIIYASEDASFSDPTLGMAIAGTEMLFEPWDLGPRRAKEFLFTGEAISALDAFRMGFVNKVVPLEKLEEEVMTLARKIALTPPMAVQLTKASINRTMDIIGQTNAWQQHFTIHQFSHLTDEATRNRESRQTGSGRH